MMRRTIQGISLVFTLAVAGCGSSASSGATSLVQGSLGVTASAAATSTLTPAATPTPTSAGGAGETATPTPGTIDPCSLLTSQEASQLDGVTLGAGKEETAASERLCVYSNSAAKASVTVGIIQGVSVAAAQAAFGEAQLVESRAYTVTQVPSFADGAFIAKGSVGVGTVSTIYVLDGSNVFFVSAQASGSGPTDNAIKYAATLVLGSLP